MKKFLALLLALSMLLAFAACSDSASNGTTDPTTDPTTQSTTAATDDGTTDPTTEPTEPEDQLTVMTFEEYMAAELQAPVCVETYVQATQSWWDDKITVYCQGEDGAYFLYELACSEEDAAKLVPGTKIRVNGYKTEFEGEVEIMDATFEFIDGESYIPEALDATALLGTDELIAHQNEFVYFKGMTVEEISYKNGEPGDDIYVTVSKDGQSYSFCVEIYLTGTETQVYQTVGTLSAGDVVDIEGFLYWYQGANPHIISITVAE